MEVTIDLLRINDAQQCFRNHLILKYYNYVYDYFVDEDILCGRRRDETFKFPNGPVRLLFETGGAKAMKGFKLHYSVADASGTWRRWRR